jgi:CRP-like cAMP-binding protein
MVPRSSNKRVLESIGPDAIDGELSMVDGRKRSASVITMRNSVLRFLSRPAFETTLPPWPASHA